VWAGGTSPIYEQRLTPTQMRDEAGECPRTRTSVQTCGGAWRIGRRSEEKIVCVSIAGWRYKCTVKGSISATGGTSASAWVLVRTWHIISQGLANEMEMMVL